MTLPRSLVQPFRQGQLTVGAGWRAFFAPFNQALAVTTSSTVAGPSIYDLQVFSKLLDAAYSPVPGWTDLGFTTNFKFTPGSKIGSVMSGYRGAIRAKYRAEVAEKVSFDFEEMTRMALTISTGMQTFNLLVTTQALAAGGPLSATGTPAIAMGASGYSATGWAGATSGLPTLAVASGSGALFPAGSLIVCDQDYTGAFGFVGDSGANVFQNAVTSVDYTRMTSDYVARVIQVIPAASSGLTGQDALILSAPFVGGGNNALSANAATSPQAGSKIQAFTGYASREGGTYIKEWSAIFVLDTVDGSQIMKYYPRVATDTSPGMTSKNVQGAQSIQSTSCQCALDALAYDDPLDGETVVSYTAYFPHANTDPQI